MENLIDDLSFSGIVSVVENDVSVGKKILVAIYEEDDRLRIEELALREKLDHIQSSRRLLLGGIENVLNHLKLEEPLNVVDGDMMITFDNGISVNTNFI